MTNAHEGKRAVDEMRAFREYLKSELGEQGYVDYLEPFKTELQKKKPEFPAGTNYMELTDLVMDRIEENTEISEDAKEMGKALYFLAAVELMGGEEFIIWALTD